LDTPSYVITHIYEPTITNI